MSPFLSNYIVQVASSAVIALLLWHYFAIYRQAYLRYWAMSFTALNVWLVCTIGLMVLRDMGSVPTDASMVLISWLMVSAGYTQIFTLLAGVWSVLNEEAKVASPRQLIRQPLNAPRVEVRHKSPPVLVVLRRSAQGLR